MKSELYYNLLSVPPVASPEEVKRAYHITAKANHPDLFPESERHIRELKMMRINEAYMVISQGFKAPGLPAAAYPGKGRQAGKTAPAADEDIHDPLGPMSAEYNEAVAETAVGFLKDPAYVYYKRGFEYYKRGYSSLYERTKAKDNSDLVKMISTDSFILRLSIQALQYFQKSFESFHHVIQDHPDSVWFQDAQYKIRKIEGFNRIYQRICQNITDAIKHKQLTAEHRKPTAGTGKSTVSKGGGR